MAIITHNGGRFSGSPTLNASTVSRLVDDGVWSLADLDRHGLKVAEPFVTPEGKQRVGVEYFSEDGTQQLFNVEDVPRYVPDSITPLQARKALRVSGYKEAVDGYVATLSEDEREEWEYALEIRRDNPILVAGAAMLQVDIDELFILGVSL